MIVLNVNKLFWTKMTHGFWCSPMWVCGGVSTWRWFTWIEDHVGDEYAVPLMCRPLSLRACCSITCPSSIDGIKSKALASVIDNTLYLLLPWLTIYFSSRPRPGRFSAVFTDWNFPKILFYCLRLWSIFSFFSVSLFGCQRYNRERFQRKAFRRQAFF